MQAVVIDEIKRHLRGVLLVEECTGFEPAWRYSARYYSIGVFTNINTGHSVHAIYHSCIIYCHRFFLRHYIKKAL